MGGGAGPNNSFEPTLLISARGGCPPHIGCDCTRRWFHAAKRLNSTVMRPASVSGLKRLYRHSRRWDNAIELPYKMCVMRENFSDAD